MRGNCCGLVGTPPSLKARIADRPLIRSHTPSYARSLTDVADSVQKAPPVGRHRAGDGFELTPMVFADALRGPRPQ